MKPPSADPIGYRSSWPDNILPPSKRPKDHWSWQPSRKRRKSIPRRATLVERALASLLANLSK